MWIVGQRVLAELEPELGLGTVIEVTARFIEVLFPGAELTRRYAQKGAPLKRLRLTTGQKAKTKKGVHFVVAEARESEGLLLYVGEEIEAWEYELDHLLEDTSPLTLLLQGRWGDSKAFPLREMAWHLRAKSLATDLKGLVGPRVALLPHQFYIAQEVAQRQFPRVLLADEVGLGKTIEAGLIFSSLRAVGRAGRVLIVVPDSLKHQWLAEMYRRFNEMFSLVDEERNEQEMLSQGKSAFHMNQKVICPMEFFLESLDGLDAASDLPWDLLVIDEAHHLEWEEGEPSAKWEVAYALSKRARGLLLLTATPENHGTKTEFGLLHLVDPDRFPNFAAFQEQAEKLKKTAKLAQKLEAGDRSAPFLKSLGTAVKGAPDLAGLVKKYESGDPPTALIKAFIDRHGTGRVLIRNRRERLKGFPARKLCPLPLTPPPEWADYLASSSPSELDKEKILLLASGQPPPSIKNAAAVWLKARATAVHELLKTLGGEKALLICSRAKRAADLHAWFKQESSMRTGLFHEALEIVERDRQAAWFAQSDGAQVLLCSEIGGEGRNFQFAHHLVLFDLPLDPDILEQRIGRLDRIGQNKPISIHVPYFEGTAEEALYKWYANGLESFLDPWNGGPVVEEVEGELVEGLAQFFPRAKDYKTRDKGLKALIEHTHAKMEELRKLQRESQDILVDLNSYDQTKGKALVSKIKHVDEDPALRNFLGLTFEYFGVELEDHDHEGTLKAIAHSLTFVEHFPGLSERGENLLTFNRHHALAREDVNFVTWDHAIAQGALSLLVDGNLGKVSVVTTKGLPESAILECLFVAQATAPPYMEIEKDFPPQALKLFVTMEGKIIPEPKGFDQLAFAPAPAELAQKLASARERFHQLMDFALLQAQTRFTKTLADAKRARTDRLGAEVGRLKALRAVNPLVSEKEIDRYEEKLREGLKILDATVPRLDALRLVLRS